MHTLQYETLNIDYYIESCGIQPINEWVERRRREWDQHVTRMYAEKLVKISIDNIRVGRSPGCPKRRWSDLIID